MWFRAVLAFISAFAIAILWGCTSNDAGILPDADFFVTSGQAFGLRVGDTVGIQTPSSIAVISFSDVLSDTRCPTDVACVTAGEANVIISVQSALAVQDVQIPVPPSGMASAVVEELLVEVLELDPAAQDGVQLGLLDYRVALRVTEIENAGP